MATMLWRRRQRGGRERDAAIPDAAFSNLQQEMQRVGVALDRIELGALVDSIVEPARALARGCQVRLDLLYQPPVSALADPMLARQALLGALSSLITARPGRLRLVARGRRGEALLEMSVQPPLPESDCPELARRLAAATELMQMQGGRLEWASAAHCLQSVRLSFRMAEGARALLIDDNESLLQLFERYLVAEGYLVTGVTSALRALGAIEQRKPDVIVKDVMMRSVDGWQLLQRLRAMPDLQHVPIVVCSVLNEPELARALGAQVYLKKPVSQQQLLAALQAALGANSPVGRHPGAP